MAVASSDSATVLHLAPFHLFSVHKQCAMSASPGVPRLAGVTGTVINDCAEALEHANHILYDEDLLIVV